MRIQSFKIQALVDNHQVILYPTLIEANGRNYLVDCGYEETYEEFVGALVTRGVKITDLYAILVSHDDIDHIGALKRFKDSNPNLIIYSSRIEERSISGKEQSERLMQAELNLLTMNEEHKPWALKFIEQLRAIKRVSVDITLNDNETLENEIHVVSTPGHTKGHISFYIPSQKTLIANDAIVVEDGQFGLANPQFTLDIKQAVESVVRIKETGARRIICYHGGTVEENVSEKLSRLIEKCKRR